MLDNDTFIGISSKNTRLGFIKKVYAILSFMLVTVSVFLIIACCSDAYQVFIKDNLWLGIVAAVVHLITGYGLVCYKSIAREVPKNYIWLSLYTLATGYLVSFISLSHTPEEIIIAASLTAVMVLSITVYACTTKTDFTTCGAFLFVFCVMLIVSSVTLFFIPGQFFSIAISLLSILGFSLYLIYDTQLLVGGKTYQYSTDDYIIAAFQIFIDIIKIFLEILKIVAAAKR